MAIHPVTFDNEPSSRMITRRKAPYNLGRREHRARPCPGVINLFHLWHPQRMKIDAEPVYQAIPTASAVRESWRTGYGLHPLRRDVPAGLTVGIIAIPPAWACCCGRAAASVRSSRYEGLPMIDMTGLVALETLPGVPSN